MLQREFEKGEGNFWVYRVPVYNACSRCDVSDSRRLFRKYASTICKGCFPPPVEMVDVPISTSTVGVVERAIHGASIGEKGSEHRAHGTFIKHLGGLPVEEEYKQALCAWAPTAMMAFMVGGRGAARKFRKATLNKSPPSPADAGHDKSTGAKTSATLKQEVQKEHYGPANEDITDGLMRATHLEGDEYGEEDRLRGEEHELEPKVGAIQIGPDLIPVEVMGGTVRNLKAGLAKRVKPLPFKPEKDLIRKIERTTSTLIEKIFNRKAVQKWREEHPTFGDFKSSKWSTDRWHQAWDEALMETSELIEQTFQIKVNEALPAKGKAPRPIIQCGDKAQIAMKYPVKCFEDLLFHYFEDASIKHLPKHDAMKRVAKHLRQRGAHLIEGDGSAWDSCCGPKIRSMTENRIIRHIIKQLGMDPEVPEAWMEEMIADMEKKKIKGKVKSSGNQLTPVKVIIDSIRQSGHAGTSCFNWLINFICWISVMSEEPWRLIHKTRDGKLVTRYQSAFDKQYYDLKYAFEGDDSALSTTQELKAFEEQIEQQWTSLGFRMKLVYATEKLTFTGFDFLCDKDGPTGTFLPEIARNIGSASWSCSSELKMHPHRKHKVGAAAMLARAENFKACGAYSRYFAALGLAHVRYSGDFGLEEAEALRLGIQVSPSVKEALQELYDAADRMDPQMRKLVDSVARFDDDEQELRLLACDFEGDPLNDTLARELVPFTVWDPAKFDKPRR